MQPSDAFRIPPLEECSVDSAFDPETSVITITLKHWSKGEFFAVSEDLPPPYSNMGYHARKNAMQTLVRRVQIKMGKLLRAQGMPACQPQN